MSHRQPRPVASRAWRTSVWPALLAAALLTGAACAPASAPAPTQAPAAKPAEAPKPAAATTAPAATAKPAAPAPTLAPAAAAKPTGPKVKVPVGVSVQVFSFTPLYVGKEKGFFDEQNLDMELNIFKSGAEAQQALLADAVMVGAGGLSEALTIAAQGVDTKVFLFIQDALVYKLVAKPEIKTVDDLKGKTMGISRAGSLTDQVVRITLAKLGKDPNMVTYQQSGGSPQRLAALQAGALDATILDAPSNQLAARAGFNTLVDVAKLLQGFPYEVGYAKKETIDKNRDVFLRFTKAYIKSAEFVNDPKNKGEVIKIAAKYLDLKEDDARIAYEDVISYFPKDGMPKAEGTQLAIENMQKFGEIPGSEKVTTQQLLYQDLVNEAKKS